MAVEVDLRVAGRDHARPPRVVVLGRALELTDFVAVAGADGAGELRGSREQRRGEERAREG